MIFDKNNLFLPADWNIVQQVNEQVAILDTTIQVAGIEAHNSKTGKSATGSAGALESASNTEARSYYELLERIALTMLDQTKDHWLTKTDDQTWQANTYRKDEIFPESDEPDIWQYSLSNGCALATNREQGCTKAVLELIERDAVLRSWMGETVAQKLQITKDYYWFDRLTELYNHSVYRFESKPYLGRSTWVYGCFLFPKTNESPLIFGFGAGFDSDHGLQQAVKEATQRLGFLTMDPLPDPNIAFAPTAYYHQDYYLTQGSEQRILRWLSGGHKGPRKPVAVAADVRFVDITPKGFGELYLIKAISFELLPLVFGNYPLDIAQNRFGLHPIA